MPILKGSVLKIRLITYNTFLLSRWAANDALVDAFCARLDTILCWDHAAVIGLSSEKTRLIQSGETSAPIKSETVDYERENIHNVVRKILLARQWSHKRRFALNGREVQKK